MSSTYPVSSADSPPTTRSRSSRRCAAGRCASRVRASLAATSGVHTSEDVLKMLMVGADVTMLCSVLFRKGTYHLREVEKGLVTWMEEHEYESVKQMRGSMSQLRCPDPSAFERAQYMRAIKAYQPA